MENKENNQQDQSPSINYCLYARKSSESDERQALSIDSQITEMLALAKRDNLKIADIRKESHSARATGQRPVFNQILEDIKKSLFNGILTWAPDRLSRNAGDLGALVDLMDEGLILEIRCFGQTFTNSPNEKFLLMILGSQAKLENDHKGVNVKRGLRAKVSMGLWPGVAPTGYFNEKRTDRKGYILLDTQRAPIIKKMFERVAYEKWSIRQVCAWLRDDLDFKTAGNKHLTLSSVHKILRKSFYTGTFEYPTGSGDWYTGKHTPTINQELFDRAQQQLGRNDLVKPMPKEFAFTKLMKCGLCGSGITADEKIKKQKNGVVHHYIYYGCTRGRDLYCKGGYIREEELIKQLTKLIDKISVNELGMKAKLEREVKRFHRFQQSVLDKEPTKDEVVKDVDIKNYAKYILKEGSISEKRDLLILMKSRLVMINKKVVLEK